MGEPALKNDRIYTYGDYKTWPEEIWELIDGTAWILSPAPNRSHQKYSIKLTQQIINFLEDHPCEVYASPFDVLLPDREDQEEDDIVTVVQSDISVICDKNKLTFKGCTGAPDWIIDPGNRYVHVYVLDYNRNYPEDPKVYLHDAAVPCTVIEGLSIDLTRVFAE